MIQYCLVVIAVYLCVGQCRVFCTCCCNLLFGNVGLHKAPFRCSLFPRFGTPTDYVACVIAVQTFVAQTGIPDVVAYFIPILVFYNIEYTCFLAGPIGDVVHVVAGLDIFSCEYILDAVSGAGLLQHPHLFIVFITADGCSACGLTTHVGGAYGRTVHRVGNEVLHHGGTVFHVYNVEHTV